MRSELTFYERKMSYSETLWELTILKVQTDEIEKLIKSGKLTVARRSLLQLNLKKVPRNHVEQIANLCYRANLPNLSLRLLGSFHDQKRGVSTSLSESEMAEYAIALSRLGATREAKSWMSVQAHLKSPKALLYKSFIHITEWEYEKALPLLYDYLGKSGISEYQSLVAKTNLAAAHLFLGEFELADPVLKELISVTSLKSYSLLLCNAHELSAQFYFRQNKNKQAFYHLKLGQSLVSRDASAFIYLKKWNSLLEISSNPSKANFKLLYQVRDDALKMGLWECVRECDFYLAKFQNDSKLLHYILYGTPHESYKQSFLKKLKQPIEILNSFQFSLGGSFKSGVFDILDISKRIVNDNERVITKSNSLFHKLLIALTSDFYRPFRLGTLFSHLYPDEYYHPTSSPDKVHQSIRRFRSWIKRERLGLNVIQKNGAYSLQTQSGFELVKPLDLLLKDQDQCYVEKLKETFQGEAFTLKQAQEKLRLSQTKTFYIIKSELDTKIKKLGVGRATKYLFVA